MFRGFKKALEGLDQAINAPGGPLSEPSPAYLRVNRQYTCGAVSVRLTQLMAEGGYSFVYAAEDLRSPGAMYAVKFLPAAEKEALDRAQAEIDLLRSLPPHPCTMKFIAGSIVDGEAILVTEMLDGGSLAERLQARARRPFRADDVLAMMGDTVEAVAHLHAQHPPIAHRDIKLENILYDRFQKRYKLCDFGSCTTKACRYESMKEIAAEEEVIAAHSTLMYRAPEMVDLHQKKFVGEKVDVWALGCLLYTLLYFEHPFQDGTSLQILNAKYRIPETPEYPPNFTKLIKWMLHPDPETRPDVFLVLEALNRLRNRPMEPGIKSLGTERRLSSGGSANSSLTSTGNSAPTPTSTSRTSLPPAQTGSLLDLTSPVEAAPSAYPQPGGASDTQPTSTEDWADFDSAFTNEEHEPQRPGGFETSASAAPTYMGSSIQSDSPNVTTAGRSAFASAVLRETTPTATTLGGVQRARVLDKGTSSDPFGDLLKFAKR